jgi:hypothetical protein
MKYRVSIERVESFLIEADDADTAVDLAFDISNWTEEEISGALGVVCEDYTLLEHTHETLKHTIEEEGKAGLVTCRTCGRWVDLGLGAESPGAYADRVGSKEEPFLPGDYDDICAVCGYAEKGGLCGTR